VKQSGIGVSHSDDGLRAMCQARHVNVDRIAPRRDLWWYPYRDASHKLMLRGMRLLFGRRFRG
jgi:succinate-semialdehyde dehydrogenase/glutarate-semialdehyde dehydrogenase